MLSGRSFPRPSMFCLWSIPTSTFLSTPSGFAKWRTSLVPSSKVASIPAWRASSSARSGATQVTKTSRTNSSLTIGRIVKRSGQSATSSGRVSPSRKQETECRVAKRMSHSANACEGPGKAIDQCSRKPSLYCRSSRRSTDAPTSTTKEKGSTRGRSEKRPQPTAVHRTPSDALRKIPKWF